MRLKSGMGNIIRDGKICTNWESASPKLHAISSVVSTFGRFNAEGGVVVVGGLCGAASVNETVVFWPLLTQKRSVGDYPTQSLHLNLFSLR